jgi:predicted Zn-dependent protease
MQHPLNESQLKAALRAACKGAPGADVQLSIMARESGFLRYAVNQATQSGVVSDLSVSVTCALGKRHASAEVHGLRLDEIAETSRRALELARRAPEDPEWLAPLGRAALQPVAVAWSDAAAALSPQQCAAAVAESIAECKSQGLIGAGFLEHSRSSEALATSAGFLGLHHGTRVGMTTTARTPDGTGSGWADTGGVGRFDALGATRIACQKAKLSRAPRPLEPGHYQVVLEPAAVSELVAYMLGSLDARAVDEGRSCFSKPGGESKLGTKVAGSLTLSSDPWSALAPSAPFDAQGMPRQPINWIEDGVLKNLFVSRWWARKSKRAARPGAGSLVASGPSAQSVDSLLSEMERGLLITRFWYVRMLEPQTLTLTGLTRDGVFLVEKGQVVGPVNNFRFNQSVPQMFVDADAYGAPVALGGISWLPMAAPALRCSSFYMASRSDAV